ncbi:hypothetical protein [Candidatus Uabimicrobium sp. HlEnr_7]|uniref:hypothetical protein n=1 Tax=Candidatus Uabimicrobium helgolandensis TaxID=3095367 RepID=UPI00355933F4
MKNRYALTIVFGLHVIWTGLWRNIEAGAYKPKALWFCFVMGLILIIAGFLYRKGRNRLARVVALIAISIVFTFYLFSFISAPEKDATFRVGLIILSSIAAFVVVLLPDCEN